MDNAIPTGFRLSPIQQRLWRLHGGRPGPALHSHCALRLPSGTSPQEVAEGLRRAVARHEILRTAFPVPPGMSLPLQAIHEAPEAFILPIVDLRALPPPRREETAAAVCAGLAGPAFDLETGAPLRAVLTIINDPERELALSLPALCGDLPTLEMLASEILSPPEPDEEPVQFADIAEWEYQLLEGEDTAEGVERWRELWQTAGISERLGDPLPLERLQGSGAVERPHPRPSPSSPLPPPGEGRQEASTVLFSPLPGIGRAGDGRGAGGEGPAVPVPLASDSAQAVAALAAAWETPLPDLILAAWQAVLQRSRGEGDVLIGALHDGRRFEELHGALGPLARRLPVTARISSADTLRTLLERTRAALADAARRQQLFSWEHTAGADRDRFFPIGFQALGASGLIRRHSAVEPYALELVCETEDGGPAIELRYDPRRFSRAAAELLAERLATLLRAVTERPEALIGDLEILGPGEARKIERSAEPTLKAGHPEGEERAGRIWGQESSARPDPSARPSRQDDSRAEPAFLPSPGDREGGAGRGVGGEGLLHHRFAAQAARTPERLAVLDAGAGPSLTFAELDAAANRLGHHLRALGAGPESRIAVALERSFAMLVAVLGILKAGAAWMPVDPSHPADRLAFLLSDAGASLVVTEQRFAARFSNTRAVLLDTDAGTIAARPATDPGAPVTPQSLAYVIYTSGSTGRPKGVLVEHRSPLGLLAGLQDAVLDGVDGPLRASLNAPLIFDASVQQLVLLLAGHTLCILPEAVRTDGAALLAFLRENAVDLFDCTPSQLRLLLAAGLLDDVSKTAGPVPSIVLSAGEAMDEGMWQALGGSERTAFFNIYGPTECTVDATAQRVDGQGRPTIGRPLAGYEAWVLDRHLRPVPIGAPGEICLGGAGLARGYLGRPDATAERFVPHPSARHGERLYRTGDLARLLLDGRLEFLGRADHQIKIRGYRIEPGEIEAALAAHPWVREALVIARQDSPGQALLTAYITATAEAPPHLQELHGEMQAFLGERLPAYMIPAAFVPLAAFPLTPSGKVDRNALPAPDPGRLSGGAHTPPRNPREATLAAVWAEVLGVDRIGIDDSFFAFGGDSIRSLQVQALAREQGVHFTVQQLFEHQTIRALAAAVDFTAGSDTALSAPFSLVSEEERQRLPEDIEDAYPLAQLQTGMVFHTELSPESGVYQDRFSFTLRGPLDIAALDAAAQRLTERHPILRTSFDLANPGGPLQRVHRTARLPFAVTDLRDLDPQAREQALDTFLEGERTLPFDWSQAPLLRIHVHRLDAERNQFTLTEHHSILDGWSVASLLAELFNLYRGIDSAAPPPSPAASFREYVALERQALAAAEQRAYWQRAVGDGTPSVLPRLGPPPAAAGPLRHEVIDPEIPAAVADGLRALARAAAVPLKSVLLAAHLRALAFLCGGGDVMTGLSSDGRPEEPGADRVLGIFVSMLPFRFRLAGGSWLELARRVFAAERELLPFRRFPMAEVQRLSGGPLFETAFNFVHFHVYQGLADAGDLQVERSRGFELLDLPLTANFGVDPFTGRITLGINAHLDVLSHERLVAVAGYYLRTLTAMADDPHGASDAVPLLSAEERSQTLLAAAQPWPDSPVDPGEGGLHELFEAQAARTPEAIAAVCEGERLTYGDLNLAADRLAHRLRAAGAGPESRVGIAMERSLDLVVALLAVLKAGAAYVPLDPGYPRERLEFMMMDADLSVLLTQRPLVAELPVAPHPPAPSPIPSLPPGEGENSLEMIALRAAAPLSRSGGGDGRGVGGEGPAYMIYTSGSTGRPKGAVNTHRAIRNRLLWMQAAYGLTAADRVLQKTPISFDVSVWEFFWPLTTGARLVLARPGGHLDPAYLAGLIAEEGVTTLHFVPSLLQLFLAEPGLERCTALRRVICSGEALPAELVQRFFDRFPEPAELHNLYGPTEAAVDVTAWPCRREVRGIREARIPIGHPVANTQIHLLDPFFQLVPVGTPGELCIGGVQLARGYHNRPELTAERFVPDPFGTAGSRLYRTGDLARRLPDGAVDYLGRLDFQVKVRGVRIELGEIEAALRAHPAVRDAAVTAGGDQRLGAYVVPVESPVGSEARDLLIADLRDALRSRLPEPMLPTAYVLLDALPLTPSGKLDRRALPAPETALPDRAAAFVAPRNETEEMLAAIWAEVLGVERVGIHDNFLELGGHSLFAMQLISRVRAAFAVELPLRSLFDANTVAALAVRIVTAQAEQADRAALERMLAELEGISDSEAQSLLAGGDEQP